MRISIILPVLEIRAAWFLAIWTVFYDQTFPCDDLFSGRLRSDASEGRQSTRRIPSKPTR